MEEVARRRPLPIALATGGCSWRRAAVAALDGVGLPWRMAYGSASLSGCLAVALAGLAVTVSMPVPLPDGVRRLGREEGLPMLPDFAIGLLRGPGAPVAEALARHIEESFRTGEALEAA
jgi:DNA-binding transcriptional LysR family regulator